MVGSFNAALDDFVSHNDRILNVINLTPLLYPMQVYLPLFVEVHDDIATNPLGEGRFR